MNRIQRTWWQEMGAISRGMMFLGGSIATPASVESSEEPAEAAHATLPSQRGRKVRTRRLSRKMHRLLENLMLLGGRPASVRHNDDIDEPFPARHQRRHATRVRHSPATQECTSR